MKANVIDSIMGSGKTTSVINYINNNINNNKYIYITPYLNEVDRIINSCKKGNFKQPEEIGSKLNGLKRLLAQGENIVTTHSLFHYFDDEIIELCYSQDYILFMDEVTEVVEPYELVAKDTEVLLKDFVTMNDKNMLVWREDQADYPSNGKFAEIKRLCENGSLAMYGGNIVVWLFPIKVFEAFPNTYILTYMFDGQIQKYYYDFFNLEYNYMHVEGETIDTYHFVDGFDQRAEKNNYEGLINIIDNEKLNLIGDIKYSLSKTWYKNHIDDILVKTLNNNVYNYFRNILRSESGDNMWTTFKEYKPAIKGKGYAKGFVPLNARATNNYANRHNVAYLVNRYFNTVLKQFFIDNNIEINEDSFALSEMLQFIWRSAIRNGESINLYIPSNRMRNLLINWIKST